MANNLFVEIEGLALYRLINNQWKIFFPKAPSHPFKLTVRKREGAEIVGENEYVFARGMTEINFLPDNNDNGTEDTGTETKLSNLNPVSIAKLHETYFGDKEIALKDHTIAEHRKNYAGILSLNGAKLGSMKKNSVLLGIWTVVEKRTGDTIVIERTRKTTENVLVGSKLIANYEIKKEANIQIRGDSLHFDLKLPFDTANTKYDLIFSNDCETLEFGEGDNVKYVVGKGCMDISDFHYYYKIIDESNLKGRVEFNVIDPNNKGSNGPCSPSGG